MTCPLPAAPPQTLDVPPRLASALTTPLHTPLATPLAPPPPPPIHLSSSQPHTRSVPYAGVDHTLGPSFSDEEDGDDTDFMAAKMASLGLEGNRNNNGPAAGYGGSMPSRQELDMRGAVATAEFQRRVQAQQQLLQLQMLRQQQQYQQQTAALHNLLVQSNDPQQLREAMALLELQRAQLAATTPQNAYSQQMAAQQILNQRALQHQMLSLQAQQQAVTTGQRQALAAQLEAGTLRREREREREMRARPLSPVDTHLRAAWEGAPSGYFPALSPPIDSAMGVGWNSMGKAAPAPPTQEWPFGWNHTSATSPSTRTPPPTSSTDSSTRAPSPPTVTPPPSSAPAAPLGRFARARQELAAAQAAAPGAPPLAALLSRRRQADDDALSNASSYPETFATSPQSETAPSVSWSSTSRKWSAESGRKVSSDLGHLDPTSYMEWGYRAPAPRSQSFSVSHSADDHKPPRSQIHIAPAPAPTHPVSYVTRQPFGPPGSVHELAQKNFASR